MSVLILKEFRDNKGVSREEQSEILGITINTLNTWEYRNKEIPKNKINYVKNILDTYVKEKIKSTPIYIDNKKCNLKECADYLANNYEEAKRVSKLFNLTIKNDNRDYLIKYLESKGFKVNS